MPRHVAKLFRTVRSRAIWGPWFVFVALALPLAAQSRQSSEARLKAAYILKFSQYVSWPDDPARAGKPILIGVSQDSKILPALREEATALRGRTVEILPLHGVEDALKCQVVFIGNGEIQDVGAWVSQLRGRPILLVSDLPLALENGLTIRLVEESKSLRFDVSQTAAEASGLKLDPQMLRYARSIQRIEPEAAR